MYWCRSINCTFYCLCYCLGSPGAFPPYTGLYVFIDSRVIWYRNHPIHMVDVLSWIKNQLVRQFVHYSAGQKFRTFNSLFLAGSPGGGGPFLDPPDFFKWKQYAVRNFYSWQKFAHLHTNEDICPSRGVNLLLVRTVYRYKEQWPWENVLSSMYKHQGIMTMMGLYRHSTGR